jgi:hypothetical protein
MVSILSSRSAAAQERVTNHAQEKEHDCGKNNDQHPSLLPFSLDTLLHKFCLPSLFYGHQFGHSLFGSFGFSFLQDRSLAHLSFQAISVSLICLDNLTKQIDWLATLDTCNVTGPIDCMTMITQADEWVAAFQASRLIFLVIRCTCGT